MTTPTAGQGHAQPQHNAFAHELLAADPAVHDVGPSESSAPGEDLDEEERFDAG
jgi:hypothetical protein